MQQAPTRDAGLQLHIVVLQGRRPLLRLPQLALCCPQLLALPRQQLQRRAALFAQGSALCTTGCQAAMINNWERERGSRHRAPSASTALR